MNKKTLFMIAPAIVALGAITGCKGGGGDTPKVKELSKLEVSPTLSPATYEVGYKFEKADLNVTATWSDGSFNTVKEENYSVSPELPYTFKDDDIASGKDFIVTYLTKSQIVHVNVKSSAKSITANYNSEEGSYVSSDAGNVAAGTVFNGVIEYNNTDPFNCIIFSDINENFYPLKIKDTSPNPAFINVTQIKSSNGTDITDTMNDTSGNTIFNSDSSEINDKLYVTFTVTKSLTSLIFIGGYIG